MVEDIFKKTKLQSMSFTTCLGGTYALVQMVGMIMVEKCYHWFYRQVPLHREIMRFKDGGQAAMEWAYTLPQRTNSMTSQLKDRIRSWNDGEAEVIASGPVEAPPCEQLKQEMRPILIIFLGMCSCETEIYA